VHLQQFLEFVLPFFFFNGYWHFKHFDCHNSVGLSVCVFQKHQQTKYSVSNMLVGSS